MPTRANTLCRECGRPCAGMYCQLHLQDNSALEADRNRNREAIRGMYKRARWMNLAAWLRRRNAQCQRLRAGVQCWHPSEVVHHLIAPQDRLDLFYTPSNLVCLCNECHPASRQGTPEWRCGIDFCSTQFDIHVA
jgi:hypothetical protein